MDGWSPKKKYIQFGGNILYAVRGKKILKKCMDFYEYKIRENGSRSKQMCLCAFVA